MRRPLDYSLHTDFKEYASNISAHENASIVASTAIERLSIAFYRCNDIRPMYMPIGLLTHHWPVAARSAGVVKR